MHKAVKYKFIIIQSDYGGEFKFVERREEVENMKEKYRSKIYSLLTPLLTHFFLFMGRGKNQISSVVSGLKLLELAIAGRPV